MLGLVCTYVSFFVRNILYKEEEEGGGVAGITIIKYNLGLPPNQRRVVRPEENWIKDIDPFDKYLFIFTASV